MMEKLQWREKKEEDIRLRNEREWKNVEGAGNGRI